MAAKDGEVLGRKQEPMASPLMGPLQIKGGFVYALSREGFWLCSMPLSGTDHIDHITLHEPHQAEPLLALWTLPGVHHVMVHIDIPSNASGVVLPHECLEYL